MKKLLLTLISLVTLSGCVVINDEIVPLHDTKTYKVFQVLSDGNALASECKSPNDKYCLGETALLLQGNSAFYDGLRVTLIKPTVEGAFRYETRNNFIKTVPIIR